MRRWSEELRCGKSSTIYGEGLKLWINNILGCSASLLESCIHHLFDVIVAREMEVESPVVFCELEERHWNIFLSF